MKSASSSITMSEFNAVRREMQAKFEAELKDFKDKLIAKLENDIADTVKSSVATAMDGINATINSSLHDNNKTVYANMQAERNAITDTMTAAVSKKMDLSIGITVTRALTNFWISERCSSPRTKSPARKKQISSPTPGENADKDNVEMHDGDKIR
jgi:isopropylmalate/homocitrate/citramalate synthase